MRHCTEIESRIFKSKRAIVFLLFSIFLSSCSNVQNTRTVEENTNVTADTPLTVMTYNIRMGYGRGAARGGVYSMRGHSNSLTPVISAIASVDPDIVGLQEVDGPSQAKEIAEALNLNHAYVWHETGSRRSPWWGVALLSKYPIESARQISVSGGPGNTKSAISAVIRIGDRLVTVFSIHKDKDLSDGGSFKVIGKAVERSPHPVILTGDFNVAYFDRRFDLLGRDFVDTALVQTSSAEYARSRGTFGPSWRIDYVLIEKNQFEVIDAGVVAKEHERASDHLAYFAKVILR